MPEVQLFEPDDLVESKNDKMVLNSLMEIARHCYTKKAPKLIQLEREIEVRSTVPPALCYI